MRYIRSYHGHENEYIVDSCQKDIIAMKDIHSGSMSQNQMKISGKSEKSNLHKNQCQNMSGNIMQPES